MNNKKTFETLLIIEKMIIKEYIYAIIETNNNKIHDKYLNMFDELDELQRKIIKLMIKKKLITIEKIADDQKEDKIKIFEKAERELV